MKIATRRFTRTLRSVIVGFLALATAPLASAEDAGPFYLAWTNTCWILKVFVTADNVMYGEEIGCSASDPAAAHKAAGLFNGQIAALGYEYQGDPRVYKLAVTGKTLEIFRNTVEGNLSAFNNGSGKWALGTAPTVRTTAEREAGEARNPND